jgi:hypothetical protein
MKKIQLNGKEYLINCSNVMCSECEYIPNYSSQLKCKLFDLVLDHLNTGFSDKSGWKRLQKCIDAEIKH